MGDHGSHGCCLGPAWCKEDGRTLQDEICISQGATYQEGGSQLLRGKWGLRVGNTPQDDDGTSHEVNCQEFLFFLQVVDTNNVNGRRHDHIHSQNAL